MPKLFASLKEIKGKEASKWPHSRLSGMKNGTLWLMSPRSIVTNSFFEGAVLPCRELNIQAMTHSNLEVCMKQKRASKSASSSKVQGHQISKSVDRQGTLCSWFLVLSPLAISEGFKLKIVQCGTVKGFEFRILTWTAKYQCNTSLFVCVWSSFTTLLTLIFVTIFRP